METIRILGTKVDAIRVSDLHNKIAYYISKGEKAIIANVNIHALNLAYKSVWFREFINNAAIVFCDGAGVILGAKILGYFIPERITYADWMWQFAHYCATQEFSLYLLGSKNLIAEKAAKKLTEKNPNLRIVGCHHGYFEKTVGSKENISVINEINNLHPDVLVVGFGMPLQERWIMENIESLNINIALTGGAVFDFISGELKRGPKWMTDNGFEWLSRLLIEPSRLWRRYLLGIPLFFWRVLKQKIVTRKMFNDIGEDK